MIYSFRYRTTLPASIQRRAPKNKEWIIRPAGRSRYVFVATNFAWIEAATGLAETKIPDATPNLIARYAQNDEQALLAKLRYNRLVDIFTGVVCYPLQSHLRTTVSEIGQIETDDIYIGVDRRGAHYVLPMQAKGNTDCLSVVQIEQDVAMCKEKFPALLCRPLAAQFMRDELIALFEFEEDGGDMRILSEKHYRLIPADELTDEELATYRGRSFE